MRRDTIARLEAADPMTRCDDCGKRVRESKLAKTLWECDGLSERLDPGDEIPIGECACGAFAYYAHKRAQS